MDLGAYMNIGNLSELAKANGIEVPRLRGYRLMVNEQPITESDIPNIVTFNKYAGREGVLYIHARIGGDNWPHYKDEVENQPWFIEKVDDYFDSTYCDIYARIK